MNERTPEDVATGVLRIAVGGTVKAVPTLKIAEIPEWAGFLDTLTSHEITEPKDWAEKGVSAVSRITNSALMDVIVAYDRTGALGGREWLTEHADPRELSDALLQMGDNAFPLGGGGGAALAMSMSAMLLRELEALDPAKSTNGASPSGTSRPNRSTRRSTRRP